MKRILICALMLFGIAMASCGDKDASPECVSDSDCERGRICAEGACEPAVCPEMYSPVCGVDGMTYSNECFARAAHVEVAYAGACLLVCAGIAGIPCAADQVCDLPSGMCHSADLMGVCVQRPEACIQVFDPVCGCDGITYSNDCQRLMAGVQKDRDGACPEI